MVAIKYSAQKEYETAREQTEKIATALSGLLSSEEIKDSASLLLNLFVKRRESFEGDWDRCAQAVFDACNADTRLGKILVAKIKECFEMLDERELSSLALITFYYWLVQMGESGEEPVPLSVVALMEHLCAVERECVNDGDRSVAVKSPVFDPYPREGALSLRAAYASSSGLAVVKDEASNASGQLLRDALFCSCLPSAEENPEASAPVEQVAVSQGFLENRADFKNAYELICSMPPLNQGSWSCVPSKPHDDWEYGTPPAEKANYAWLSAIISSLTETGTAYVVISNDVLWTHNEAEAAIRKTLVDSGLIKCVISLPARLLFASSHATSIIVLSKRKSAEGILMIDALEKGSLFPDGIHRYLPWGSIFEISAIWSDWKAHEDTNKKQEASFEFVPTERIAKRKYLLAPELYLRSEEIKEEEGFSSLDQYIDAFKEVDEEIEDSRKRFIDALEGIRV